MNFKAKQKLRRVPRAREYRRPERRKARECENHSSRRRDHRWNYVFRETEQLGESHGGRGCRDALKLFLSQSPFFPLASPFFSLFLPRPFLPVAVSSSNEANYGKIRPQPGRKPLGNGYRRVPQFLYICAAKINERTYRADRSPGSAYGGGGAASSRRCLNSFHISRQVYSGRATDEISGGNQSRRNCARRVRPETMAH